MSEGCEQDAEKDSFQYVQRDVDKQKEQGRVRQEHGEGISLA